MKITYPRTSGLQKLDFVGLKKERRKGHRGVREGTDLGKTEGERVNKIKTHFMKFSKN